MVLPYKITFEQKIFSLWSALCSWLISLIWLVFINIIIINMADLFLNIIFNMTGWILISLCRNIYRCDFYVLGHYHVGKVCLYIFFRPICGHFWWMKNHGSVYLWVLLMPWNLGKCGPLFRGHFSKTFNFCLTITSAYLFSSCEFCWHVFQGHSNGRILNCKLKFDLRGKQGLSNFMRL